MAERRMFHGSVVGSDAFLDLPVGAQALYFHLGMHADDDGFVNGTKQVTRRVRRRAKDLQALVDGGFLLDFDGVVVLRHWLVSNTLKSDRMKSMNFPEIAQQLYVTDNREYSLLPQGDLETLYESRCRKLESKRNPKVREGKLREDKINKDKIRQVSVVQDDDDDEDTPAAGDPREDQLKQIFGQLGKGVVYLSDNQTEALLEKLGLEGFDYYVNRLSDYIVKNDAKISNHYATILRWWQQDKGV